MADAKKCDRCGKFYTREDKKFLLKNNHVCSVVFNNHKDYAIEIYDLCDECTAAVYQFVNSLKEETNESHN